MNAEELFNKYEYDVEFTFSDDENIDISNTLADCFARFIDKELQKCK